MHKCYEYVGPHDIAVLLQCASDRMTIQCPFDAIEWIHQTKQHLSRQGTFTVTFVIDPHEQLWIADRHSEHVVCAQGQAVLTAGELTFVISDQQLAIVAVTNQSTGYCPEPESWTVVTGVCERLGVAYPAYWTTAYLFRRCARCGNTNLIKDDWFVCAICDGPLSATWNYA